ncbi:MAG: hypothetical protein OEY40_02535 [Candidatus Bathyarchaeota archaeon]|nr:hypothetical protein [Candidatus Bathyarchaeota archaeon]MDH5595576.1 hypothetical protein [Candidatus Bathyarchaeota archaeon]
MVESLSLSNFDFPDEFEDSGSLKEFAMSKYATFGVFQLVGNGVKTNEWCGKFSSYRGCVRVDLHKGVNLLDGTNYTGKAYIEIRSHSCHRPSCPVCYLSWASRQAHKIEGRLAEARKRFGKAEHVIVSLPTWDYGLGYEDLRKKVVKVLKSRGVIGGCLIFHGFRYNNVRLWYWSPHFHVLGVIKGGYGCRNCNHERGDCRSCSGFNGREVRGFEKDGYIVKVMGERKTVFGTAWYQLNHSTIRTNVKRPHACTWFGVCSYRKLKVKVEKRKSLCPICGEELVKLHYLGVRCIVKAKGERGYVPSFVDDLVDDDGSPNWLEASSGSYEY